MQVVPHSSTPRNTRPPPLNGQHYINILPLESIVPPCTQQCRALEYVLDLPTVQLDSRQLVQVRLAPILPHLQPCEEVIPDVTSRRDGQVRICQADVDARLERWVNVVDAVTCQEKETFKVLQRAEEDGDELITLKIMG